ncbi:Glycogen debranching protein-like protein [Chthoniobacter flavus Ellin428]|uniref:Glycogen debranching protein-like protein n=1 Tax=Chthoniobacter flavus Ellin428 TaxID=497964 RepID=B4D321_9BACT|nr:trehalase family glycosidase [Chthoniobacter flavus]EDY19132.1 Glycogen debranching protein-like protein [Chthoniobacter flavus Ellin428]TCO87980.1 trehalase [Chthoniobacter flavus]
MSIPSSAYTYCGRRRFLRGITSIAAAQLIGGRYLTTKAATPEGTPLRDALAREAALPGNPAWKPMLLYLAELHGQSVHPPLDYFRFPFEDIGPGYQGGKIFGHFDLTHQRLDTVRALPEHARNQLRNELAGQQPDGFIPGVISFDKAGKATWKPDKGFPPLWVVSAEACVQASPDKTLLAECYEALRKQIGWFEAKRMASDGGFYYLDVIQKTWESGMDEGIRCDERPPGPAASVDATAHVYMLYDHAARWSGALGKPDPAWTDKAPKLQKLITTLLWDDQTGFFYDSWSAHHPELRHLAFEGMWPMVVGAATPAQAKRVIDEHLLNSKEFFTAHPIATVARSDSKYERRMWRGPAWNCMTYWAARGCLRYGRADAARALLEKALDATAAEFDRSGTVWEFYDADGGEQKTLARKAKGRKIPCVDYLGHNPLFAMVDLWRQSGGVAR